jgi:DNA-binding transcriptional ArsR family regulator
MPPVSGGVDGIMPKLRDRAEHVSSVFESRYPEFQYRFIEFLVEHLTDLSREFRGDLQMPMILAIIGQVGIGSLQKGGPVPDSASGSPIEVVSSTSAISASRIADVTGISRQTVRRKLEALESRGWIEQLPDRSWRLRMVGGGAVAQGDLAQIDTRSIKRVSALFAELERLVGPQA